MELPVVIYGSPVLRKKSFNINTKDDYTELSSSMMQTLKKEKGVGLAAPQVGSSKNLFIIDTTPYGSEVSEIIEKADESEIREAYQRVHQAGIPVVYGENPGEGIYHYHPTRLQVKTTVQQTGFKIVK